VVGGVYFGSRAYEGKPLGIRTPESYLEWRAERVKIRLVGEPIKHLRLSPEDCTLYLGKADGTVVLWNHTKSLTVRIPESNIAMEMGEAQEACPES
jgi:fibrillarin-like rRNA methylase